MLRFDRVLIHNAACGAWVSHKKSPGANRGQVREEPCITRHGRELAPVRGIEPRTRGFGDRRSATELHRYVERGFLAAWIV